MSYRQHRMETSIADGFLNTRRIHWTAGATGWIVSFFQRIAEHRQRSVLRRKTKAAMGKLDERMLKDIGWPGRYNPEGERGPDNR
ncbi:MAG: hypothetical protein NXI27_05705 [Alphaproteobacteria bacterium]|nr:hypothetical protein [Alphaproteobacteria bacterium]